MNDHAAALREEIGSLRATLASRQEEIEGLKKELADLRRKPEPSRSVQRRVAIQKGEPMPTFEPQEPGMEQRAIQEAELVKRMVERFLQWKLPDNFNPDGGISFKKMYNEHTSHPMKHEPVGTNLFDYTQAEQMVRYMLAGEQRAIPEAELQKIAEAIKHWICIDQTSPIVAVEPWEETHDKSLLSILRAGLAILRTFGEEGMNELHFERPTVAEFLEKTKPAKFPLPVSHALCCPKCMV